MFNIPTYKEAKEIVDKSDGTFYEKIEKVDGNEFAIFNYRLANYKDFKDERYYELRGITYNLENGDVFPSIHKFYNQNENELVSDELLGSLEVRRKLDGSLIQPIVINDKVYYKTKGTFNSEQVKLIEQRIKIHNIDRFVLDMYYEYNILPLFELVSPFNQIVIDYPLTDLVLIQMRKINTGEYLSYPEMVELSDKYKIPIVLIDEKLNMQELLRMKQEIKGEEGWVVWNKEQSPTSFRKIKTDWYLTLHRLISPNELVEHKIIQHILSETIDDVLQNIPKGNEKRKKIEYIITAITHYFNKNVKDILSIYNKDKDLFDRSRKAFVDKYKNYDLFPVLMRVMQTNQVNEEYVEEQVKHYIEKNTYKQQKAKDFLNKITGGI